MYADTVLDAIGERTGLVVVAQSFGGFTAPLVCDRVETELLVLVAGMIPSPGEPPDDWWANTGYEREVHDQEDDEVATFYHDVPPELATEALKRVRAHPSATSMREPWPLAAWPDVPTRFLLCRDDRFFPAVFLRRVARRAFEHHTGRDRRRALRRPQPPGGAGGSSRGVRRCMNAG